MASIAVLCGLTLDFVYLSLGISAVAIVGEHSDILPESVSLAAVLILLLLSIQPLMTSIRNWSAKKGNDCGCEGHCGV
jgi:hypothetical protein